MQKNWPDAYAHVIKSEGGYVNDPQDPGGRTNLGVTQKAWEGFLGRPSNEAEMRALTKERVQPFYKVRYWDVIKGDDLPSGVDYATYDFAVNSGVGRAAKFLQEIVGVKADGKIGPATLAAVSKLPPEDLIQKLCEARLDFLRGLPTFPHFGNGWTNRVNEVEEAALDMAD